MSDRPVDAMTAAPPRRRRRWRRLALGLAVLVVAGGLSAAVADRAVPLVFDRFEDHSAVVVDREGRLLRAFVTEDGMWRLPAGPGDVAPLYLDMLLAYEDRRFDWHPGVDPVAVLRAAGQAVRHGEIVSGASTLTMQAARLLEPRSRDLGGKLAEMLRALQLEWHHDKETVLSVYLTLAPFGGNLEGVRAASLAYFGHEPDSLTAAEAALLVALPQSPTARRPDRHPDAARAARDKVLDRMVTRGVLTTAEAAGAKAEPVPTIRRPLPFLAPHLTETVMVADADGTTATTLDAPLQEALEDLAARTLPGLDPQANLAILVAENATGAVRAYIGSADYFADRRAGQVDLVRAVRSPGSTLKPFIYGMAFEDRLAHPDTLIADVPRRFGDYAPTNFDPEYSGDVTVREALIRSLNIPAVTVLDRLGPARLAARLRQAGAPLVLHDPAEPPGLPIALGGVGVSLWDLVTLYAGLANGGSGPPLAVTGDPDGATPEATLMQPFAAWYVTEVLSDIPPPSALVDPVFTQFGRRIAYKTGTSYGFRDAWAIGYDARYTVGVWVGRPDGTPSPSRYGRNTAAPVLFQAFDLLPAPGRDVLPTAPAGVIAADAPLPERLRRFDTPALLATGPLATVAGLGIGPSPLAIDFPVDGTTVELPRLTDGTYDSLPLIAIGGQRPLRWLVNGRPVTASAQRREAEWHPDGTGQTEIVVRDAAGRAARVSVWVR